MATAIGSSPTFNVATSNVETTSVASMSVAATAAIEAQITRDKKELSNCVNCKTAETKQGQANIQALSNKIKIAEAHLNDIKNTTPDKQPSKLVPTSLSDISDTSIAVASSTDIEPIDETATTQDSSDIKTGKFIDFYV